MTLVFRCLENEQKQSALEEIIPAYNTGMYDHRLFIVDSTKFDSLPNSSFVYWISTETQNIFSNHPELEGEKTPLVARRGVNTNEDFRFLRLWFEVPKSPKWIPHPKGGEFSPIYGDVKLVIDWDRNGDYLVVPRITKNTYDHAIVPSKDLYFKPGLTWSRRTKSRLSMRIMPKGCIFGDKGPAVINSEDDLDYLLAVLAITNSNTFYELAKVQLAAADAKAGGAAHSFEVGVIQKTPMPEINQKEISELSAIAKEIWNLKYKADSINETSHAFIAPYLLLIKFTSLNLPEINSKINHLFIELDTKVKKIYLKNHHNFDFDKNNRQTVQDTEINYEAQVTDLISWFVGIQFGRFTTPERFDEKVYRNQQPFDELWSPISDQNIDSDNFLILPDDQQDKRDLIKLLESQLINYELNLKLGDNIRQWFRKSFFPSHLQKYSGSRRQAPIYWPLQTPSGSYTLWVYYHRLNEQTLYS